MAAVGNLLAVRSGLKQSRSGGTDSKQLDKEQIQQAHQVKGGADIVKQYDHHAIGKLQRDQVRELLEDLSRNDISEDELDFVFKVADANGDDAIGPAEMSTLLSCWANYANSRHEIEVHFRKHDPTGTGRLYPEQLHNLLVELRGGKAVSPEELRQMMNHGDLFKNGEITKPELRRVLELWRSRLDHKASSCGCPVQ